MLAPLITLPTRLREAAAQCGDAHTRKHVEALAADLAGDFSTLQKLWSLEDLEKEQAHVNQPRNA